MGCDRPSSGRNDVHVSHSRCDSDLPASFNRHFPAKKYVDYRCDGPQFSSGPSTQGIPSLRLSVPTSSSTCMRPSDAPGYESRSTFLPYSLQVSATYHSSMHLGQLFSGEATSRPLAHAAPEGPLSSFWGYVGHRCASCRC